MKCKTFKYKNYENCFFNVGNYMNNKMSMAIGIMNKEEENITVVTVNMSDYLY